MDIQVQRGTCSKSMISWIYRYLVEVYDIMDIQVQRGTQVYDIMDIQVQRGTCSKSMISWIYRYREGLVTSL